MSTELIRMTGIVGVALIAAITVLSIFHPGDNTATIATMVSAAVALLSFLSSRTNAGKIDDNADKIDRVHDIVTDQRTERDTTAALQQQQDEDRV